MNYICSIELIQQIPRIYISLILTYIAILYYKIQHISTQYSPPSHIKPQNVQRARFSVILGIMEDNITKDHSLTFDYHSNGKTYKFRYYELANYSKLDITKVKQVYGVCFYQDKMVIVLNGKKKTWGLVGGKPKEDESIEQTLKRRVQEESNMQVLKWRPIGVQEVTDPNMNTYYQLRVVCKVKPFGDFVADPAGTITEIKLINPKDYLEYFDWGKIGEQIIQRAVQLKPKL